MQYSEIIIQVCVILYTAQTHMYTDSSRHTHAKAVLWNSSLSKALLLLHTAAAEHCRLTDMRRLF